MKHPIHALVLGISCCLQAADIHVSPAGRDTNPGTREAPFATLERARQEVRLQRAAGAVTVWLHAGVYWLPEPFTLGAEDSGRAGAPVTYRAMDGAPVWLNGGVPLGLADFTPVRAESVLARLAPEARHAVRHLKLPPELLGRLSPPWPDTWWTPRQLAANSELFCGSERLTLARWPNDDYTTFGPIVTSAQSEGETPEFRYADPRHERWSVAAQPYLFGYWRRGYRAEFIRIAGIDTAAKTVRLAARNSLGTLEDGGACRYFAVNLLEELDSPGEWYLDRGQGVLYLWPTEPMRAAPLYLSVNQTALIEATEVEHVHFRGIGLECSARDGIRLQRSSHCQIIACEVRNVAFDGIVVSGDHNRIAGCDVHHTGDVGIAVDTGDRYALRPGGTVVENCHVHHTNRIVRAGSRAVQIRGVGATFAHNLIHDTGYIAVRFDGNDHVLEYNRLFRTNVESTEGGVFYIGRDWTARGSCIRFNFIHHVEDSREGCGSATRFVHLDDSAPEIEIHGNVCYRLGGGVSICGGAANHVHDNLYIECHWGVDIGPRGQDMFQSDGQGGYRRTEAGWPTLATLLERYKWNQPPYSTRYPRLVEIFMKDPIAAPWFNVVTRNAMVDCGFGIRQMGMQPGWSTVEDNWELDDPGFVEPDRTKLDFRLREDGPLRGRGFQPIPFSRIGLFASPERRSWPVVCELPAPDWRPRWMHLRDAASQATDGLPIFKVMAATAPIVVDGTVDPMEWTPGDATGAAPEIHAVAELDRTAQRGEAVRPSQAMLQTDGETLYVCFHNPIDPATGATQGNAWGRDDAVEIAIAELDGDTVGPVVVWRGYANGRWETSNEAGAPAAVVERASQGVRYAARVKDAAFWSAEWAIPFAALGIRPTTANPRLAFNLSVRKPAGDEWVMWSRGGGSTWNVRESGLLWLAQFGEMAPGGGRFVPVGRIDIDSRRNPVPMTAGTGCSVAEWARPVGCYLTATTGDLKAPGWHDMQFSFTPNESGVVTLKLMGSGVRNPGSDAFIPIWTYADAMQVEGAALVNGSFEAPGEKNIPHGWRADLGEPIWVHDPAFAAHGDHCIKTWHNGRLAQDLHVTAGREVRIRLRVRGR